MKSDVIIYTDGACKGNPGVGGWGAWFHYNGHEKSIFGGEENTTNNRMELTAAIKALESLNRQGTAILYTDSKYVKDGITTWIIGWKARNWKTAAKKPVKNVDLWQALDDAVSKHDVEWRWVKGHAGHPGNERADELARRGVDEVKNGA